MQGARHLARVSYPSCPLTRRRRCNDLRGLLADDLPIRADGARTAQLRITSVPSIGRCGLVPSLQFLPIRCDEAKYDHRIQAADEDRLEACAGRLNGDGVSVGVSCDLSDTVK